MRQYGLIILYVVLLYILNNRLDNPFVEIQVETNHNECLESFEAFAYDTHRDSPNEIIVEPLSWEKVASLPPQINLDFPIFNQVSITRIIEGEEEIWITGNGVGFAVYNVNQQKWDLVSRLVFSTDYIIGKIFLSSDGTIWGQNTSAVSQEISEFEQMPVLSQFNEAENRFEVPDNMLKVPIARGYHFPQQAYSDLSHILVDEQGIFWIIVSNDGIYQFNPIIETYEKRANLEFVVSQSTLSIDNSLYLWSPTPSTEATLNERLILPKNSLWDFNLVSNTLMPIDTPTGWIIFHGMLVNQLNQLWLGAVGYRDSDYTWHLKHPNIEDFFDDVVNSGWVGLILVTETSDGKLWFIRYTDSRMDGTAWYDPQLHRGCLIMNYATNIIESYNKTLWMVAGNSLYKYSLEN